MTERISNLLHRIPGYTGYRDKESRRDEDKRLRVATADRLTQIVDQLTASNAAAVSKRDFSNVSAVEQVVSKTRLLADRIRTASYGYAGLFSDRPIDEAALDQLRQFDIAIQSRVQALADGASAKIASEGGIAEISSEVDRIATLFDARGTVIETAKPARDKVVIDLLDTSTPPTPSPFVSVKRGDAFEVLGDDFQANATVELRDGDVTITFIRVSETEGDSAVWFVGASTPDVPSARLVESSAEATTTPAPALHTATATVDTERGRQERVAAGYAVVQSSDASVELILTLAGTQRRYTGTPVHDLDVEVYGSGKL
ncbi:MAG: hypothetical protein WBA63_02345 [Thermomicrobiales bacterium]